MHKSHQKGHLLEFHCVACQAPVNFSVFDMDQNLEPIPCTRCGKCYLLQDETLVRQLKKFIALCYQIRDSEEILSNTSVAINVGTHQVEVPYKLLLTRLSTKLNLKIGDQQLAISFRFEPIHDVPTKEEGTTTTKIETRTSNEIAFAC